MKQLILLTIVSLICWTTQAQEGTKFKETKNIYLLDVTISMFGKVQGSKDIFDEVRTELIEAINAINNEKTEITLVTFQDDILDIWEGRATANNKKEIIKRLNAITAENVPRQNTNIHGAWKKGKEVINPERTNVIYLLTDGEQNVAHTTPEDLYREIRKWEEFSRGQDYYAFLVELTEESSDPALRQTIQVTPNAQIIKGIEFYILAVEDNKPVVNVHDELSFKLNLLGDRMSAIPKDFEYEIHLKDQNFEIINNTPKKLANGPQKIRLKAVNSLETLKEQLDNTSQINFELKYDEEKYPQVKLLDHTIICTVNNKKEMVLYIEVLEEKSGR